MQQIYELKTAPSTCSYLPNQQSSYHYLYIEECQVETYQLLLERGYRRFGKTFFRHQCTRCHQCKSIRVPIASFKPSKSQRRVYNRNEDIVLHVQRPQVSQEHLELFRRYHEMRSIERHWDYHEINQAEYQTNYVDGSDTFGWEFQYRRNGQLLGVGLVDETINSLSSVYFYYDPDWAKDSPGTFSILKEMEFAKQHHKEYLHLGYWVKENQSLQYKANFNPHEILEERTPFDQEPKWKPHSS